MARECVKHVCVLLQMLITSKVNLLLFFITKNLRLYATLLCRCMTTSFGDNVFQLKYLSAVLLLNTVVFLSCL